MDYKDVLAYQEKRMKMTKQKIVDIIESALDKYTFIHIASEHIADELLAEIEQEKKEMAKDIFEEIDNISGYFTDDKEEFDTIWFSNEESNHIGNSYLVINTYDFDNIKQKNKR